MPSCFPVALPATVNRARSRLLCSARRRCLCCPSAIKILVNTSCTSLVPSPLHAHAMHMHARKSILPHARYVMRMSRNHKACMHWVGTVDRRDYEGNKMVLISVCSIPYTKIKTAKIWTCEYFFSFRAWPLTYTRHTQRQVLNAGLAYWTVSLYRFFAKASNWSDLSDPSGPLSASISSATIKEASTCFIASNNSGGVVVGGSCVWNSLRM